VNLQLKLILASVGRAIRAAGRRERCWAPALSHHARSISPEARAEAARQLLTQLEGRSRLACWLASEHGVTARILRVSRARRWADPLRSMFRVFALVRESILKSRHFKQ
jgi:hypothetical protein